MPRLIKAMQSYSNLLFLIAFIDEFAFLAAASRQIANIAP
jgi:hypothetical protein